ncbi:MAG: hypothetical protein O2930_14505, partial [Acidobacteria bacterium]|nr:hypothetical protein [Acidobacteriota bacterium]
MTRRFWLLVLLLLPLNLSPIAVPSASAGDVLREVQEREPNNDADAAMRIEPGTTVTGALAAGVIRGRATDIDFYRVPVT